MGTRVEGKVAGNLDRPVLAGFSQTWSDVAWDLALTALTAQTL